MFGDLPDGVAGLLGWGFFLLVATLGALLQKSSARCAPAAPLGPAGNGHCSVHPHGIGGRPLGLASFGLLALLTCIWHFRRTPWSAGMEPGETFPRKLRPHLRAGVPLLLLVLATLLATYSKSYFLLGFIKWKNPTLGVRVAGRSCPAHSCSSLWLRDRRTRGASTLTSRGLSLLVGAAALGAAASQVWPTDRLINSVLLLFVLSLPCLAWLGRRRPVWNLGLVSLISAWIVMSDPKGAIAISVISAYLVLVAPEIHLPDGHPAWLVAIGIWILAVRVALVVLLEGSFNFDSIEIATALMGNLVHSALQGALRVSSSLRCPSWSLASFSLTS